MDNFSLGTWDVVRRADPALWHLQIGDLHVRGWGCALQVPKHEMNIDRLVQWLREYDTYAVHGNKKEARRKEGKKLSDRARSLPARKTFKTYAVAKDAFQQAGLGRVASDGLVIGAPKRR